MVFPARHNNRAYLSATGQLRRANDDDPLQVGSSTTASSATSISWEFNEQINLPTTTILLRRPPEANWNQSVQFWAGVDTTALVKEKIALSKHRIQT